VTGPLRLGRDLGNDDFLRRGAHFGIHLVKSDPYEHYVFEKQDCNPSLAEPVFVFLDGDGNSWVREGYVSSDPTPPDPLALDLLALDGTCGIYISRPCTFGRVHEDVACNPSIWTTDRYSQQLISSLAGVIDRMVAPGEPLVLVGFSGGGLLASHLANQRNDVAGLITLGANLDPAIWAAYHGYMPEVAGAAPPTPFPLDPAITQVHVFGERDRVTPAETMINALDAKTRSSTVIIEEADHTCCWIEEWPRILEAFQQRMDSLDRSASSSSAR
jgi:pimeloyl-ACP methyl ester carboxylesterase